jgi:hypothetical protein
VARDPDDPDFTNALPPRGRTVRGPPGAAYFDGRYFYDRGGRRLADAAPRVADEGWVYGRDYYDNGPPRAYRPNGFFGGN